MKDYDCNAALKAMVINVDEIICLIRQLFDRFHVSQSFKTLNSFRNSVLWVALSSKAFQKSNVLRTSPRFKYRRTCSQEPLQNIQSYLLKGSIEYYCTLSFTDRIQRRFLKKNDEEPISKNLTSFAKNSLRCLIVTDWISLASKPAKFIFFRKD
jgi:hypothetical protein